jgi:hypothetical protein
LLKRYRVSWCSLILTTSDTTHTRWGTSHHVCCSRSSSKKFFCRSSNLTILLFAILSCSRRSPTDSDPVLLMVPTDVPREGVAGEPCVSPCRRDLGRELSIAAKWQGHKPRCLQICKGSRKSRLRLSMRSHLSIILFSHYSV